MGWLHQYTPPKKRQRWIFYDKIHQGDITIQVYMHLTIEQQTQKRKPERIEKKNHNSIRLGVFSILLSIIDKNN